MRMKNSQSNRAPSEVSSRNRFPISHLNTKSNMMRWVQITGSITATTLFVSLILNLTIMTTGPIEAREPSTTLTELLSELSSKARNENPQFSGFSVERGRTLYMKENRNSKGVLMSCATCHTSDPKNGGKTTTGKKIDPLAPSVNSKSLTDRAHIEKWLKRNFKSVYDREGTALEKGDVLLYLSKQ